MNEGECIIRIVIFILGQAYCFWVIFGKRIEQSKTLADEIIKNKELKEKVKELEAAGNEMREFDFDEIHEVKLAWWTLTEAWDAACREEE